jgi:hypothetical protein
MNLPGRTSAGLLALMVAAGVAGAAGELVRERVAGAGSVALTWAPAPADNPLKGFVPYAGQGREFPHSLEFSYLPLRDLMTGPNSFDWEPLERFLNDVAGRGCQAIFRVWLEYPGKPTGIPRFLLDAGLKTHTYTNTNTQPLPPALITTPDYEDPRLRAALTNFIAALGRRYDGDPRLGYITAGLLGTWGEWHTHPRNELWASKAVQQEVMAAYDAAFDRTPVLLRYPAGTNDPAYAPSTGYDLGFHDDSFGWATLPTGRRGDEWFFMTRLAASGPAGLNKWRSQPIGGEIRPELWSCLWTDAGCAPRGQDFARCVAETHSTWLMDSSTSRRLTPSEHARAEAAARSLGYELSVVTAALSDASGGVRLLSVTLRNRGVAPFYADWAVEIGHLAGDGRLRRTWPTAWRLREVVPGEGDYEFQVQLPADEWTGSPSLLALRVVNPLPNGRPFRFANVAQDQHAAGWLTLLSLE